MKKWLMLALFPSLLLLAQQAGANSIFCDSAKVGTCTSEKSGTKGYTAIFNIKDLTGPGGTPDGIPDYMGITIDFGTGVDLSGAKKVEQDGQTDVLSDSLPGNSLINFFTNRLTGTVVRDALSIVNLNISEDTVSLGQLTSGIKNTIQFTTDTHPNGLTASITQTDAGGALPALGQYTCMRTKDMIDDEVLCSGDVLSPIVPLTAAVPVPNSLLLMGIGFLVLGIPLHRGRLS